MDHLRRLAAGGVRKVAALEGHGMDTTQGGIPSDAGAGDATANDNQVELFGRSFFQSLVARPKRKLVFHGRPNYVGCRGPSASGLGTFFNRMVSR